MAAQDAGGGGGADGARQVAGAPVAMAADEPITWEDLRPAMVELGGAVALEEAALDKALRREARRAGVTVTDADADRERSLLLESLDERGDSLRRASLLTDLRRARSLGDARFAALLRRNALLRALVQPDVALTPAAIDQAYALRFGERVPARIVVAPTLGECAEARRRILAGEAFADVAASASSDASARRGGIIEPINLADPSYPGALRDALGALRPGETSEPFGIDNGFAIVRREADPAPGAPAPGIDSVRAICERDARLRQERTLMEELARRLGAESGRVVFARSLDAAWTARTGR